MKPLCLLGLKWLKTDVRTLCYSCKGARIGKFSKRCLACWGAGSNPVSFTHWLTEFSHARGPEAKVRALIESGKYKPQYSKRGYRIWTGYPELDRIGPDRIGDPPKGGDERE